MRTGKMLVVGGYGQVGRVISNTLSKHFPGLVVAVGRNRLKAEELARASGGNVLPMALDIFDPALNIDTALSGVDQVIMCLDQPDTYLVEKIIQRGVDYLDVTASSEFLAAMEKHDKVAKQSGSRVVISVGLAPGLTNLLAAYTGKDFDQIQQLDIFVMLGMGDVHGEAAIDWTLENINAEFAILEQGVEKFVRSFEDGLRTYIPGVGDRTAYRFNFPDQHSLPITMGVNSVSSRLCFDLEYATRMFAWLKKTGLLQTLQRPWVKQVFINSLKRMRFGSDQFAVKTVVEGWENGALTVKSASIRGAAEAYMTGLVAAKVAQQLYTKDFPAGVFHIDEIFELEPLIDEFADSGLLELIHEEL